MRSRYLTLTLRSDVILTATSATLGAERSLEVVPGAALLGATAGRIYRDISPEDAWMVFHSGRVRFGSAVPLSPDGQPTLPMPHSLHYPKGANPGDGVPLSDAVCDASAGDLEDGPQWKQLRSGFLDAARCRVRLQHHGSMRTALDRGRAREGFLYTLDAVARGTVMLSRLDLDDGVSAELEERILGALTSRDIRVGRSRKTEFGRVTVAEAPLELCEKAKALHAQGAGGSRVRLLLVSDLALRDPDTGAPTLTPSAEALGLDSGNFTWDPARSFLRTRRYSPFNGTWKRPNLERQVLMAGGVITATLSGGLSIKALTAALAGGIGDYRQDGLGRFLVEPRLLEGALISTARSARAAPRMPGGPLADWLGAARDEQKHTDDALKLGRKWAQDMRACQSDITAAQWGQVRQLAARTPAGADLQKALKTYIQNDRGELKPAWGMRRGGKVPGEHLLKIIGEGALPDPWLSQAVVVLAADITRGEP